MNAESRESSRDSVRVSWYATTCVRRSVLMAIGWAVFASAALACRNAPEDTPAIEAELLGYRALAEAAGDGAPSTLIPEYDAESLPVIRLDPRAPERGWSLAFTGTSSATAELEPPLRRGPGLLLRATKMRGRAEGSGRLELALHQKTVKRWEARFTEVPDQLAIFKDARTLRTERKFEEVERALAALIPSLGPRERLQAAVELARTSDAAGKSDQAIERWRELASSAKNAGVPTEASRALRNAAYAYQQQRRVLESVPLLDEAEAIDRPIHNVLGQSRTDHYRAIVFEELGDYRSATQARKRAAQTARELGLDRVAAFHEKALAALLQNQGQHDRALVEMSAAAEYFEKGAPPEDRASYENDFAWVLARGMAQNVYPHDFARVRALFGRALAVFRERREPARQAIVVANLMWLAYLEGDRAEAAKLLEEARALDPGAHGRAAPFTQIVAGELALDAHRHREAIDAFERAVADALRETGGLGSEYVWRGQYGVARALAMRGDKRGALARYRAAIAEMNRVAERIDLRDARTLFFDDRRRLVDDAIRFFLEQKLTGEAMALADDAQTNLLRALEVSVRIARLTPEDRDEWNRRIAAHLALREQLDQKLLAAELAIGEQAPAMKKEAEELRTKSAQAFDRAYAFLDQRAPLPATQRTLPKLAADEALIVAATVNGRTLSFLQRGQKLSFTWQPPVLSISELTQTKHLYLAGIDPSDDELAALLPEMSVSLLPWVSLLDRPKQEHRGRSLVVADPAGNLPHARREGEAVAAQLEDAQLYSGEAATRAQVLAALANARVFHFAGHGVLGGKDPWESRLELAAGEALRLEDLLIARPGVEVVVLSGCDTGRAEAIGKTERIGLSEAFVAAGARAVMATVRPVVDVEAQAFIRRFYAAGGAGDPAGAHRRATLAAIAEKDNSWRGFRIFGRR